MPNTLESYLVRLQRASKFNSIEASPSELETLASWIHSAFSDSTLIHESRKYKNAYSILPDIREAAPLAMGMRVYCDVDDSEPFLSLPQNLNRMNIFVYPMPSVEIMSTCAILDDFAFIFVSNEKINIEGLYGIARQLGNLFVATMRKKSSAQDLVIFSRGSDCPVYGKYERFADYFALELLIPSKGLGIALQKIRHHFQVSNKALGDVELLYLSRIFGTSFSAICRRCERAQLLPRGGARALIRFLDQEFGGAEKRADLLKLPSRPQIALTFS